MLPKSMAAVGVLCAEPAAVRTFVASRWLQATRPMHSEVSAKLRCLSAGQQHQQSTRRLWAHRSRRECLICDRSIELQRINIETYRARSGLYCTQHCTPRSPAAAAVVCIRSGYPGKPPVKLLYRH